MDISAGLIAKGTAGALAASAAVGGGVLANKQGWIEALLRSNEATTDITEAGGGLQEVDEGHTEVGRSQTGSDSLVDGSSKKVGEIVSGGGGGTENTTDTAGKTLSEAGNTRISGDLSDSTMHTTTNGNTDLSDGDRSADAQLQTSEGKADLTRFDSGLIDFLKIDGGDIVFEVKKEKGTNNFEATDLTFNAANKTLTVRVDINTNNAANLIEKDGEKEGSKGKRSTLQNLNKNKSDIAGTPWTWTCKVKFDASDIDSFDGTSIHNKDKIFSSTDEEGFFNLLKKNASTGDTNIIKEAKNAKEKFIRACAKRRTNNSEIEGKETLSGNEIKNTITIGLKLGVENDPNGHTNTNTLYPKEDRDKRIFEKLFGETTAQQST